METSVDPNPSAEPKIVGPIAGGLASQLPPSPLIVWAAPPFNRVLLDAESWDADGSFYPKTDDAHSAINHLRNTIELLTALKPTWWFIEQPKSLVRRMPLFAGFNRGYPTRNRQTILHTQFGGGTPGTSDVWTNAYWWLPNSPDDGGPEENETEHHARVPPYLYAQMFEQLETYRRSKSARAL